MNVFKAITARINGEYDQPDLVKFGPLMINENDDILRLCQIGEQQNSGADAADSAQLGEIIALLDSAMPNFKSPCPCLSDCTALMVETLIREREELLAALKDAEYAMLTGLGMTDDSPLPNSAIGRAIYHARATIAAAKGGAK